MTNNLNNNQPLEDDNLISVRNIIKKQGLGTVLGPISLDLKKGEILGIRGENGAGKSTLLKVITGITKANSGTVVMSNETRKTIGYVPQDIALYPSLSGRDNLAFWAGAYSLSAKQKTLRINWLLKEMKLEDKANVLLQDYSGGMKRRLNLAAALLITPTAFLLDEPTVGADHHSIEIILSMMTHIRNQGAGVIFISHRDDELERICHRIITLEKGKIIEN